jgi:hypothetical protein
MTTYPSRTLSVRIERPYEEAYGFLADHKNFPKWASGMDTSVPVTYTEPNDFGVVDHTVHLPGLDVYVPLRVLRNGTGVEVLLTVFRLPGTDDAGFEADAAKVSEDLGTLKEILER